MTDSVRSPGEGTKFYEGVDAAVAEVERMEIHELLEQIDSLYGRDHLYYGASEDEVRAEAVRQTRHDFLKKCRVCSTGPYPAEPREYCDGWCDR